MNSNKELTRENLSAFIHSIQANENELKQLRAPSESPLNLTILKIPNGITRIGEYAFCDCSNLEEIDLSECTSLIDIDKHAFDNCDQLTYIDLSGCIKMKGVCGFCFKDCKNAIKLDLPKAGDESKVDVQSPSKSEGSRSQAPIDIGRKTPKSESKIDIDHETPKSESQAPINIHFPPKSKYSSKDLLDDDKYEPSNDNQYVREYLKRYANW